MNYAHSVEVTVTASDTLAEGVRLLQLTPVNPTPVPRFAPGAHIDLHLPGGLVRQYSLINASQEGGLHYEVAVGLAAGSRGGSLYLHQQVHLGQRLQVSGPRNNFELQAGTQAVVFIAGGIGITPIRAMIQHCLQIGRPWRLVYAARSPDSAAFVDELRAFPAQVQFHFDALNNGAVLDVASVLKDVPADSPMYCCGPAPLMSAVKALSQGRAQSLLHFEWFEAAPSGPPTQTEHSFEVRLARAGSTHVVPPERSILDVLEDAGIIVPSVCKEGLCGTCECAVLEGDIEHKDQILSAQERASNQVMMICVSRAKTGHLVLDL